MAGGKVAGGRRGLGRKGLVACKAGPVRLLL